MRQNRARHLVSTCLVLLGYYSTYCLDKLLHIVLIILEIIKIRWKERNLAWKRNNWSNVERKIPRYFLVVGVVSCQLPKITVMEGTREKSWSPVYLQHFHSSDFLLYSVWGAMEIGGAVIPVWASAFLVASWKTAGKSLCISEPFCSIKKIHIPYVTVGKIKGAILPGMYRIPSNNCHSFLILLS